MTGSELKNLRESRNLSQRDLAKIIDIHHTSVSRWEDGQEIPSPMQKLLLLFFQGTNPFGPATESTKIKVELEEEEFEELRQLAIRKGFDTLKSYLSWAIRKHLQEVRASAPTSTENPKDPYRPLYPNTLSKVAEEEVPFRVPPKTNQK